jgi:hypothetical protein
MHLFDIKNAVGLLLGVAALGKQHRILGAYYYGFTLSYTIH